MPFDALTIAAVRQELEEKIVGGRIQNLVLPGPLTLSLEIYRPGVGRSHLLISAHPQHARVHLTPSTPSRDPEQHPPLLLLLRKYVRGGIIVGATQPRYERILTLSISKKMWPHKHQEYHFEGDFRHNDAEGAEETEDEDAPITTVDLVIEVMGRLSNIVLVEADGTVMDGIKRIPPSLNRYRATLPHMPYVPPPPQDKRDPLRASINSLALALAEVAKEDAKSAAWKGLVSGLTGVSPTLAREVVFRALGNTSAPASEISHDPNLLAKVLAELRALFGLEETGNWEPTVAWRTKEGERQPVDFAPYRLTHLEQSGGELQASDSISEATSEYYAGLQSLGGHSALKGQVRAELDELRRRDERRLSLLREELVRSQALDELRRKGELLLGYAHTVQPGQRQLVVTEEGLTIDIDPSLSPVENAQALFKEYRKARSAQEGLPDKVAEAEMRVRFLDELTTNLDLAATHDDIRAVQSELQLVRFPAGRAPTTESQPEKKPAKGKARKPQEKIPQPLRLQTRQGAPLLVGRTAVQNDVATFRLASPDDLWFHARNVPGAHVILRTAQGVTPDDIEEAASVAAAYSSVRAEPQVDVIYTEKRFVRKVPNGPPGFVTYKNERVVRVAPTGKERARA